MLNLDALKGLSYQKGCYPGQEVIARLHYRGEVKKRVQIIKSEQELTIGSDITASGNKVGTVINAADSSDGKYYGFAVIELDKIGEKLLSNNSDISILELPYSIDS